MTKIIMKHVAAILGLSLDEEFKADGKIYRFTGTGMELYEKGRWEHVPFDTLLRIGKIENLPWKPRIDEYYWFISDNGVAGMKWHGSMDDLTRYAVGNTFPSSREATAAKNKIVSDLQQRYIEGCAFAQYTENQAEERE